MHSKPWKYQQPTQLYHVQFFNPTSSSSNDGTTSVSSDDGTTSTIPRPNINTNVQYICESPGNDPTSTSVLELQVNQHKIAVTQ